MRTKNLFRSIVAATLAVVSTSAFAQDNTTAAGIADAVETDANEATDYVTVGAIMPYNVTPFDFGAMASDFNPSNFVWNVTTGVDGTDWQMYDPADGSTFTAASTTTNLLSAINIGWITPGARVIQATENSNPVVGTGCPGTTEDINVLVINRPIVAWNGATTVSTCNAPSGAGVSVVIPVDISGTDRFNVTLSCTRTPLTGAPSSILSSAVQTPAFGDVFTGTVYEALTAQTIYTLNVAAGTYGRYVFTIEDISDRISRKSGIAADAADYPAAATTYTVLVLPTPTTGQIKHVKNVTAW